jgi:hypothetical protein
MTRRATTGRMGRRAAPLREPDSLRSRVPECSCMDRWKRKRVFDLWALASPELTDNHTTLRRLPANSSNKPPIHHPIRLSIAVGLAHHRSSRPRRQSRIASRLQSCARRFFFRILSPAAASPSSKSGQSSPTPSPQNRAASRNSTATGHRISWPIGVIVETKPQVDRGKLRYQLA